MKNILFFGLITGMLLIGCTQPAKETTNQATNDKTAIEQVLEDYKKSINESDTTLARTFWLTDSRVSFIHPRGHEKGWDAIKKDIYDMFGSNFSKRDLKSYDETITLYGDMAILEFYWIFDAIFAGENPAPMQTKGRETQVLKKIDGQWRIVHIHYSGMPMTGEREGF